MCDCVCDDERENTQSQRVTGESECQSENLGFNDGIKPYAVRRALGWVPAPGGKCRLRPLGEFAAMTDVR